MEFRRHHLFAMACAGAALATSPAHAAIGMGSMPLSVSIAAVTGEGPCAAGVNPAYGFAAARPAAAAMSKSSAILGGQVSQLELLSRQQSGGTGIPAPVVTAALAYNTIQPGAGSSGCVQFSLPTSPIVRAPLGAGRLPLGRDDFLSSKRLALRHTNFDNSWNRVRRSGLSAAAVGALGTLAERRTDRSAIAAVNAWANARVRFVDDREQYGQNDYWATASATLKSGAGDCEDIAIVKMQMLAAMGISRSDMYLTIARDLVRSADHALLVVKLDDRFYLLDNATNELLDAQASYDYRPIMSFSDGRKWLHGY